MIGGLTLLLICQLVGEVVARGAGLTVPGPVFGLLLLVFVLIAAEKLGRVHPDRIGDYAIGRVCDGLLGNLALFFVPAGVGLVQYLGVIGNYGIALGVALLGSSLAALLTTVGTFLLVKRMLGRRETTR